LAHSFTHAANARSSIYVIGGLADSNADPTDVFEGFDTFFDEFETFKCAGLVWTPE